MVSQQFIESVYAPETGDVFTTLITIDHPVFGKNQPARLCNDNREIVSQGYTFLSMPFQVVLMAQDDTSPPQITIRMSNVDRQIVKALRSINQDTPDITIQIIRSAAPDTIEAEFVGFKLLNADYDVVTVTGVIGLDDFLEEPYPGNAFVPSLFPGLFRNA